MYQQLNETWGGNDPFNSCGKGSTKIYNMNLQVVPIDYNFGYNALNTSNSSDKYTGIDRAYPNQCTKFVSRLAAGFVSD